MQRVLILCTGNSCRSQMAEAIWRQLGAGRWDCHSAGTRPAAAVHPLALAALAETGVPVMDPRPKTVAELTPQEFDVVVTVCDGARETCPIHPQAREKLHWSFPDPAAATGTDDERMAVFRRVRDDIRAAIAAYLATPARRFTAWMLQLMAQWPGDCPVELRERYKMLIRRTSELLAHSTAIWGELPHAIREVFRERGWEWNGIYVLERGVSASEARGTSDRLRLAAAAGPPVCNEIERAGNIGTSGMCFDAVLMNQTLVAADVSRWPGYVSCDTHSGLATQSSMVCPIRGAGGAVLGVWDLDATRPLDAADALFFDLYFATLSSLLAPTALDLAGREAGDGSREPMGTEAMEGSDDDGGPNGAPARTAMKLDQLLKWRGWVDSGGVAKVVVQGGEVRVNGAVELRRGRRLRAGDVVEYAGNVHTVVAGETEEN